jgi:hypothetical protein
MTAVSPREATTKLQEEKIGVAVGGARERQQREKEEGEQGFFYRPKVADIFEILFLSPGSDKI